MSSNMGPVSILQLASSLQNRHKLAVTNEARESRLCSAIARRGEQVKLCLPKLSAELERFNPSLQYLSEILGEEWPYISASPYRLAHWVHTIRINRMVEAGVIPPEFIYRARCRQCGHVLLEMQVETEVQACPWCLCKALPKFPG